MLGRPALPLPPPLFAPLLERFDRQLGAGGLVGDGIRLLRFGRGVDNTRLLDEIGYQPRHDAVGAVRDLASKTASTRIGPNLHPGALAGRLARMGG